VDIDRRVGRREQPHRIEAAEVRAQQDRSLARLGDVMELLVDLNTGEGTPVMAGLHARGLAARYFPRILVVNGGGIAADGPPADALSRERIEDVFRVDPWLLSPPWAVAP